MVLWTSSYIKHCRLRLGAALLAPLEQHCVHRLVSRPCYPQLLSIHKSLRPLRARHVSLPKDKRPGILYKDVIHVLERPVRRFRIEQVEDRREGEA